MHALHTYYAAIRTSRPRRPRRMRGGALAELASAAARKVASIVVGGGWLPPPPPRLLLLLTRAGRLNLVLCRGPTHVCSQVWQRSVCRRRQLALHSLSSVFSLPYIWRRRRGRRRRLANARARPRDEQPSWRRRHRHHCSDTPFSHLACTRLPLAFALFFASLFASSADFSCARFAAIAASLREAAAAAAVAVDASCRRGAVEPRRRAWRIRSPRGGRRAVAQVTATLVDTLLTWARRWSSREWAASSTKLVLIVEPIFWRQYPKTTQVQREAIINKTASVPRDMMWLSRAECAKDLTNVQISE